MHITLMFEHVQTASLTLQHVLLQQDLVGFANDATDPDRLKIFEALLKHGAKAQYWGVSF